MFVQRTFLSYFLKTFCGILGEGLIFGGGRLLSEFYGMSLSFHCFAVRSSSAHEGKIIIFDRFYCSLTKLCRVKLIGKIEICSI